MLVWCKVAVMLFLQVERKRCYDTPQARLLILPSISVAPRDETQVMLYTLLLRMRYGNQASKSGLLVYTSPDGLHTGKPSTCAPSFSARTVSRAILVRTTFF